MITKIQKWGNSQGFRIPKIIMDEVHVAVGDDVELTVDHGKIILSPARKIKNRFHIDDLVKNNIERDGEFNVGGPLGSETW